VNHKLYDQKIVFPEDKRQHMKICFLKCKNLPEDTEGYQRNQELQGQKTITYQQLKRIKNFFDNFGGKQTDAPFILNGGVEMKNWVNNELRRMREGLHMTKRNKMDTGMTNQFIQPHDKDGLDVRPSKQHLRTVDKYNTQVMESLKRINELISKI
jgi:hypothetical protein